MDWIQDDNKVVTHLALIEAKAYLNWNNPQLKRKAKRSGEIFGSNGKRYETVQPHFVLMTNYVPEKIHTDGWPDITGAKPSHSRRETQPESRP